MPRVVRRPSLSPLRPVTFSVIVALVLVIAYLVVSAVVPISPTKAVKTTYAAPSPATTALTFPTYGATAVEAEGFSKSLRTSGDTKPRSIASISKIVTALVVLDKYPLADGEDGPTITFTAQMHALYDEYLAEDGEVAAMPTGLQLTERQAFQVMLMKSANNYAGSLALWSYGSMSAYRTAAAAWLKAHGLTDTTIVEPTGLNPSNKSTATDLVRLGKLALANPAVKAIVGTKTTTVPTVGSITNSNALLGVDGVDGIKTGTLDQAGACLLFAADYQIGGRTVTVIGTMLGGKDHDTLDEDVRSLLHSVTDNFRVITLTKRGHAFGTYTTPWKRRARAVTTRSASVLVWGATTVKAAVALQPVTLGKAGKKVGSARFTVSNHRAVRVPLVLDRSITEPGLFWRWANPLR